MKQHQPRVSRPNVDAILPHLLSACSAICVFFLLFLLLPTRRDSAVNEFGQKMALQEKAIDRLTLDLAEARSTLGYYQGVVTNGFDRGLTLGETFKVIETRLTRLEASLDDNPERALSVPLLRKDLDYLRQRLTEYQAVVRSDCDRFELYFRWILGGIAATFASILIPIVLMTISKWKQE